MKIVRTWKWQDRQLSEGQRKEESASVWYGCLPHRWALSDGDDVEERQKEEEGLELEAIVGGMGEYHYQPSAILTSLQPQLKP